MRDLQLDQLAQRITHSCHPARPRLCCGTSAESASLHCTLTGQRVTDHGSNVTILAVNQKGNLTAATTHHRGLDVTAAGDTLDDPEEPA